MQSEFLYFRYLRRINNRNLKNSWRYKSTILLLQSLCTRGSGIAALEVLIPSLCPIREEQNKDQDGISWAKLILYPECNEIFTN